jgi:hypothetical protein
MLCVGYMTKLRAVRECLFIFYQCHELGLSTKSEDWDNSAQM